MYRFWRKEERREEEFGFLYEEAATLGMHMCVYRFVPVLRE